MHEAIGGGESIELPVLTDSCVVENPTHVTDDASNVSGSSPGSMAAACSQMFVVEVEDDTLAFSPYTCKTERN